MNKEVRSAKEAKEAEAFKSVDGLLQRWRVELTTPKANKKQLAEEGISRFYRHLAKDRAPVILWCDSPLQISLIPVLMANVLKSREWEKLVENMKSAKMRDIVSWREQWRSEWIRVERNFVLPLLERIWNFQFPTVGPAIQQRVLDKLEEHMQSILMDGKSSFGSLFGTKCKIAKSGFWPAPIYVDSWKHLIRLAAKIQSKTTRDVDFNVTAVQGFMLGTFDKRIVTDRLPEGMPKEFLKPSSRTTALVNKMQFVRERCAELLRIGDSRSALMARSATGFMRPMELPDFDLDQEWYQLIWQGISQTKKDMEERLKEPRTNTFVMWGSAWSWLPIALSSRFLDEDYLSELEDEIDYWSYLFHGAEGYFFGENICFVCAKPETLITNEMGLAHNDSGPALRFSDGFEVFAWRGLVVDRELIEKRYRITVQRIVEEKNVELRRILLDMYGDEKFIEDSNAIVLDSDRHGVLYQYNFKSDEPLVMVKVKNSTCEPDGTYKYYYLRVPPTMATAREAVAWTFGLTADEYDPGYES